MIKTQALIQIKNNEKEFNFYCDNNATYGEVYDALRLTMDLILTKMNELNKPKEEEKDGD